MRFVLVILLNAVIGEAVEITRFSQPRKNLWVTLANQINQSSLCLSLGGVTNPFRTCLVGLPVWSPGEFCSLIKNQTLCMPSMSNIKLPEQQGYTAGQSDGYRQCLPIQSLNTSLHSPPEELDLFGSANASLSNTTDGGWFSFKSSNRPQETWATLDSFLNVSEISPQHYSKCNSTKITAPMKLPTRIFLICGDRAWNGIPARPQGGPCYLGKLSLFHPNVSLLMQLSQNSNRKRRSVHNLDCSRIGDPQFWGTFKQVVVSTILPGGSANKAMNLAKQLGCWAKSELNKTSQILDMLTTDVQSVNHAVLQNRAAIDFLLLAQGHGCEEFEGMCCMNLSDHSVSIHSKIKELQQGLHNLKEEESFGIDEWLKSLGLGPWLRNLVIYAIGLLGVILLFLLILPCVFNCIQNMVSRTIAKTWQANFLAQEENGGNVESFNVESFINSWLAEKGHADILPLVKLRNQQSAS
ncbi:syncytin-2-like [Zonotrichia albicollis]|uniref:syncytin-2-like n=1 Tax=Zonotrichia albicollis TaxID=44394 RepID=UPI003D80B924